MLPWCALGGEDRMVTYAAVEEVWQGQEAQRVSRGGCVYDDAGEVRVLWALGKLDDFGDGNGLVCPWRQVIEQFPCSTNLHYILAVLCCNGYGEHDERQRLLCVRSTCAVYWLLWSPHRLRAYQAANAPCS